MPIRSRKSINLGGGVKLNVNKKSVSVSAGTKHARYTVSSTARRTTSVGVPGTGLSHCSTTGGAGKRASAERAVAARWTPGPAAAPGKPGLFAPKGVKVLFRAVQVAKAHGPAESWKGMFDQAATHPNQSLAAHTLAGLMAAGDDPDYALPHLGAAYVTGLEPAVDPFVVKYLHRAGIQLDFSSITADVAISRELIALLLSQLHQDRDELDAAENALSAAAVTPLIALERSELAIKSDRADLAIALTDDLTNTDDIACLTLAVRAAALRALGNTTAALEVTKEALRYPSRAPAARHRARLERGRTYALLGQSARARAEYEKILADDSKFPGVAEGLAALPPVRRIETRKTEL